MELQRLIDEAKATGMLVGVMETPVVLMYEVGEIAKCIVYRQVAQNAEDAQEAEIYRKLLSPAIADAVFQLRLLAELTGINYPTLCAMGRERFEQRIADRQKEQDKNEA